MPLDEGTLRRPPALRPGQRVGVIAPSYPTAVWFPARFERSVQALHEMLEVDVVVAGQVRRATGFTAGCARERAQALQEMIADPSIRAIFTSIGGFNSAELLEHLDVNPMRADPKIVVGYSDCTSVLLGLQALAGWYTFYGPAVMTQFGEYPCPLEYTLRSLRRVLFEGSAPLRVDDPAEWTNAFFDWAGTEWTARARPPVGPAQRTVWKDGEGEGRLFGGNVETLNFLAGTPYLRVPERVVLFWEATEAEASLQRVQRALTHFRQLGLFERTQAMLIGRSPHGADAFGTSLREVVLGAVEAYTFPVVADLAFGHTDPMMTLAIGARAHVSAADGRATIDVLEAGVGAALDRH